MADNILEVKHLKKYFKTGRGSMPWMISTLLLKEVRL